MRTVPGQLRTLLLPRILPASKILSLGTVLRLLGGVWRESEGGEGGGMAVEASWE